MFLTLCAYSRVAPMIEIKRATVISSFTSRGRVRAPSWSILEAYLRSTNTRGHYKTVYLHYSIENPAFKNIVKAARIIKRAKKVLAIYY